MDGQSVHLYILGLHQQVAVANKKCVINEGKTWDWSVSHFS